MSTGESYVGEDLYAGASASRGATGVAGLTSKVDRGKEPLGRDLHRVDSRKIRYDVLGARKEGIVRWHVEPNDRMSAVEAGDKLEGIYRMLGVAKENPGVLHAVFEAIMFAHTLNSGSVLQPGRSDFTVGGTAFSFAEVIKFLGVDTRRFFRAYADEIREINDRVLKDVDYGDSESVDRRDWLLGVAADRGLSRFPDLAHDSSDKCVLLPAERVAVANAKVSVFSTIVNSVDSMNANSRAMTADKFDSTNGRTVGSYTRGN